MWYRFLMEYFLPTLAKEIGWRGVVERFVAKGTFNGYDKKEESLHEYFLADLGYSTKDSLVRYLFTGLVRPEEKLMGVPLLPDNMASRLSLSEEELGVWWSKYFEKLAGTQLDGPRRFVDCRLLWLLEVVSSPQAVSANCRIPVESMAEIDIANLRCHYNGGEKFYVDPFTSPELAPFLERLYLGLLGCSAMEKFTTLAKSFGVDVDGHIREILLTIRIYLNVPGLPELILSFV